MKRLPLIPIVMTLAMSLVTAMPVHAGLPAFLTQSSDNPSLAPMLEKVIPGVVNIATESTTVSQSNPLFDDPIFRHFFNVPEEDNTPQEHRSQSLGSGVIVDAKNGYILTNNHVIDHADKITVTLNNGKQYSAKVIGVDEESDVAVIQIPAENLTAVPISRDEKHRVGDFVVAIGNPFGLGQTVTSGIISAMGRSGLGIEGYEDFIQTDASINPGNSGGALVNLKGELIGINTAILSRSGGNIGIGFAIPITMAEKVMKQLIEHGEIRRGRLGIYIQNLTPDLARAFGIKIDHGAVVSQVSPKSSAEKAGIKSGDVITAVNGKPIRNASALRNMIGLLPIGQKVDLELIRDGKQMNITAKIGEPQQEKQEAKELNKRLEGAVLGELDEGNPMYGKVHGVLVVDVTANSPAWVAGLRKGDIITSVNRIPVNNLAEMKSALNKGRNGILMNIRRGNGALFLLLQ